MTQLSAVLARHVKILFLRSSSVAARNAPSFDARNFSQTVASSISSPSSQQNVTDRSIRHHTVGRQIGGYTIRRTQEVPEMALHAVLLEHDETGAQHLHIARADHNNVFGVGFRTPPKDSTGVAHILEHTVLCGSKKYPVRDPFFNMLNRSLSTFMNAMTSSDWTMYPFSTLNRKDYQNLMSVYLDAAFFPRLRNVDFRYECGGVTYGSLLPTDFLVNQIPQRLDEFHVKRGYRQEGIRLESTDLKDSSSPIIFKGVVFNEMKGVFSNPENIFARKITNYLLPSGTYGNESGGEPLAITSLTWEQLRDFHKAYYHPSNSRFYTYGDMPLESHLEIIQENALKHFQKSPPDSAVKPEPRWNKPQSISIDGPVNPLAPIDKQTTVAVSYLLPEVLDPFESFVMSVVGKLLISGPKAPFYKSLMQSGFGSDYAPGTGFDGSIREGVFSVGLKNVAAANVDKVKSAIHDTFEDVARTGFDQERVDAIIHEVELYLKHQTTSFGLHTFFSLMSSWNHDADPIEHLKVNQVVDRFHESVKSDAEFLQKRVKEYFLNNSHQLTLTMNPQPTFEHALKERESQLLQERIAKLDEQEKQALRDDAQELLLEQSKKPDVSVLPTLKIADIEPTIPTVNINQISFGSIPITCVSAPTNGVTYFRALISTESLDAALRPYVPLFCEIATQMGAGDMDYRQLSQKIELKTGGLAVGEHASQHFSSTDRFEQGVMLGSKCLDRNISEMFGLWKDIFNRIRLDDLEQFGVLVKQNAAELAASLADSGHAYAMSYSAASLRPAARLKEEWSGLTQVNFMRPIAESTDLSPVLDKMRVIANQLLTNGRVRCSLNSTPATMKGAMDALGDFLSGVQKSAEPQHLVNDPGFVSASKKRTHLILPFSVHYASRSFPVPPFSHQDYATCRLLAKILSSKFLHREIREKGGAYGGGARVSHDGLFHFYSYRDPKSIETFEAFEKSVEWAVKGEFTAQDIDEAKLSVFSEIDKPVAPGEQGKRQFIYFVDDAMYQEHRQKLLGVTKEQLVETAKGYLTNEDKAVSTLLGPPSDVLEEKGWDVVSVAGEPDKRCARAV